MPIYEYQCSECHYELEALRKISDPPLTECPACGKSALVKKISAVAFRLAGTGWYETDFKKGDKRNLAGDAEKSGSAGDDSGGKAGQEPSASGKEPSAGGNKEPSAGGNKDASADGNKKSSASDNKQSSAGNKSSTDKKPNTTPSSTAKSR